MRQSKMLILTLMCMHLISRPADREQLERSGIPSLKQLAWNVVKEQDYEGLIPDGCKRLLEYIFQSLESPEIDPFSSIELAYKLQLYEKVDELASVIAQQLQDMTSDYEDHHRRKVMEFVRLTERVNKLPSDLRVKVWDCRNKGHDATALSQAAFQSDPAE